MLIKAERSCLLVIDLQEKLMPAIHEGATVVANSVWLLQIARRLEVPVLASEQYPRGLGHTVPAVRALLPDDGCVEKTSFSAAADPVWLEHLEACGREQLLLVGAEAHVCVLQTALELLERGKAVYVVADCTSSRRPFDAELAMARLRAEGARVVSREMVAFEWLGKAGTGRFREISREFLR